MRNIERISENLNSNYFQMQHFISESNWDGRSVINLVAQEVSQILPKRKLTGLIIDESGWVKKGVKSVGVGHQYCGNVGKTANGQVAVFACLSNGDFASMVDSRLYLPKDWCDNPSRCDEAGIPQEKRIFKTKLVLAADIIQHLIDQGILFEFISADGYYGNDASLARSIDSMGKLYMLDLHADQTIYLERPELVIPPRKNTKGREPQKLKPTINGLSVKKYLDMLTDNDWSTLTVRNTAKGKLKGDYHFAKVYIWDKNINSIEQRLLVIRRTKSKEGTIEIKYSFTNANLEQYTPESLAYMQAQRFFVEHCIKESKQILGIDEFQTRLWKTWEHQIALNFMVSSFVLKEKLTCFDELPLLSARDIKEYLTFKLYKQMTEEEMLDKIHNRHKIRQRDINRYYLDS
ncbi:MAG: IS701 family transposase [Bacteroidales bacterium]|nr:MAG: IS701 family transposase [Bacteroidales bacterium]